MTSSFDMSCATYCQKFPLRLRSVIRIAALTALGMGALLASSCTHSTTGSKRHALSGRIVYEFSGRPVEGAGLVLIRQPFDIRGPRSQLELGRSITGTDGSFLIGEGVRLAPRRDRLEIFGITPPPLPEGEMCNSGLDLPSGFRKRRLIQ